MTLQNNNADGQNAALGVLAETDAWDSAMPTKLIVIYELRVTSCAVCAVLPRWLKYYLLPRGPRRPVLPSGTLPSDRRRKTMKTWASVYENKNRSYVTLPNPLHTHTRPANKS